ncbi:hypothetical protein J6590_100791 [Homalodisca vitripennis]|nr:hypothetical protein J6590_100791 [Homalodisca vitripennis]
MLNCGSLHGCGCHKNSSDLSYSSDSTSKSSTDDQDPSTMKKHQHCQDVVKHNGVGAFLSALSPRNLFRGFKKNNEFSMPKAERTSFRNIYPHGCELLLLQADPPLKIVTPVFMYKNALWRVDKYSVRETLSQMNRFESILACAGILVKTQKKEESECSITMIRLETTYRLRSP